MDIQVEDLLLVNQDERGKTFQISNERSGDFLLAYRKAGSSSGRHYHEGRADHKNPEIEYLLNGTVKIRWRKISEKEVKEMVVEAPKKLIFPINIWHELVALTDCSFWEMNSIEDAKKDSIRVE